MRRPVFTRWIRRYCLAHADVESFRLREMAALALQPDGLRVLEDGTSLKAALDLHAIATGCEDRLLSYYWSEAARGELESVTRIIGGRDVESLALRGTPMRSIPLTHRAVLSLFEYEYHRPERVEAAKRALREETLDLLKRSGTLYASISEATGIAMPNLSGYFKNASFGKVTVEGATAIRDFLAAQVEGGR